MQRYLLVIILALPSILSAQNIYDLPNSLQFGNQLMKTQQYSLASEEFERILFMSPDADTVKMQLIRSYFLNEKYSQVIKRTDSLYFGNNYIPRMIAVDYSRSLLLTNRTHGLENFSSISRELTIEDSRFLAMNRLLLNNEWENAKQTYDQLSGTAFRKSYEGIFSSIETAKYKSPALAVGMSAILPGSGKFYTGEWKDGLVSLIFVSAFAVQAYRGYHNYGTNSGFFIAYAGIGSVFYLGNLYGSYKSAKKFNDKIRQKIHQRVTDNLITAF
jgi:hypothetical protein